MRQYHWPGNIRELKNAVRRALLLSGDGSITAKHLNLNSRMESDDQSVLSNEEKERKLLLEMLEKTGNNRTKTAKMLDMSRTLYMRSYVNMELYKQDRYLDYDSYPDSASCSTLAIH